MAEGFASRLGIEASSAGTAPAREMCASAVQVMAERGIDIGARHPRAWQQDEERRFDLVVSMGAGVKESEPRLRFDQDWALPDPAGLGLDEVRRVRDAIEQRVRHMALAQV